MEGDSSLPHMQEGESDPEPEIVSGTSPVASLVQELAVPANSAEEGSTVDNKPQKETRIFRDGVEYRVPSHGNGLLRATLPVGTGQTGPGPSPVARLRDEMRAGLQSLLPKLSELADGTPDQRLRLADFLAKYGIGTTGTMTIVSPDVVSRLERQAMLIASRPEWSSRDLLLALRDIWT